MTRFVKSSRAELILFENPPGKFLLKNFQPEKEPGSQTFQHVPANCSVLNVEMFGLTGFFIGTGSADRTTRRNLR